MARPAMQVVGVGIAMVIGLGIVLMLPDTAPEHEGVVREIFHLPDDVPIAHLFGSREKSGRFGRLEGIVQFTPEQWAEWSARREDPEVWTAPRFTFRDVTVTGTPTSWAFRWREGGLAVITEDRAIRWARFSFVDSQEPDGLPHAYEADRVESMCFGIEGAGPDQRIDSCVGFGHDHKPDLYVNARVDPDGHRLWFNLR